MGRMCDDELIQLYADGTLTPPERTVVEAHLSDCDDCRRALTAYKALLWDLEHPASPPVPAELHAVSDSLMAAFEKAQTAAESAGSPALIGLQMAWFGLEPMARPTLAVMGWAGMGMARAGRAGLTGLWQLVRKGGGGR